jgi:adenosylhomocysteine nucleosidase
MTKRKGTACRLILSALLITLSLSIVAGRLLAADQTSPILVLYAFSEEGKLLDREMHIDQQSIVLGRVVLGGVLSGKQVVVAESGVGMTNAAMTTQKLIDQFQPQAVLFTGIAGAVDSSVRIGDIVVCDTWVEHDYGYIGKAGFQVESLSVYLPRQDSIISIQAFPVDSSLLTVAHEIKAESLGLQPIGSRTPKLLIGGVGVTGNTFIDSPEKREWLSSTFSAEITDMESAAVAQVCTVNSVPFIVFRAASDLAGGSGSETAQTELNEFFKVAAANSATVLIAYLRKM